MIHCLAQMCVFFNDTATTEIYTLSLHDALPISAPWMSARAEPEADGEPKHLPYRPLYRHHFWYVDIRYLVKLDGRSEEHTSELQSRQYLVCRLLLEKKKISQLAGNAQRPHSHLR